MTIQETANASLVEQPPSAAPTGHSTLGGAHHYFSAFVEQDDVKVLTERLKVINDVLAFPKAASDFLWKLAEYFAGDHLAAAWYLVYYPRMAWVKSNRIASSSAEGNPGDWRLPGNRDHELACQETWRIHQKLVGAEGTFRLHRHFEIVNVAKLRGVRSFVLKLGNDGAPTVSELHDPHEAVAFMTWQLLGSAEPDRRAYERYMQALLPRTGTQAALLVTNPFDGKVIGIGYTYGALDVVRAAEVATRELLFDAMHFLREQEARINAQAAVHAELGAAAAHELRNQGFVVETIANAARAQVAAGAAAADVRETLDRLSGLAAYLRWPWADDPRSAELAPVADDFLLKAARSLWLQHRGLSAKCSVFVTRKGSAGVKQKPLNGKCMRACVEILRNAIKHAGANPGLRLDVTVDEGRVVIRSSGAADEAKLRTVAAHWSGEIEAESSLRGIGLARRSLAEAGWEVTPFVESDALTLTLTAPAGSVR